MVDVKSIFQSKTLWSLVATAAAAYLPAIAAAAPAINNSTVIGTIHGIGIPLGLITSAIFRITATHKLTK